MSKSHNDCFKKSRKLKKTGWLEHFTNCLYFLSHPIELWRNNRTAFLCSPLSAHFLSQEMWVFSGGLCSHSPMAAWSESWHYLPIYEVKGIQDPLPRVGDGVPRRVQKIREMIISHQSSVPCVQKILERISVLVCRKF